MIGDKHRLNFAMIIIIVAVIIGVSASSSPLPKFKSLVDDNFIGSLPGWVDYKTAIYDYLPLSVFECLKDNGITYKIDSSKIIAFLSKKGRGKENYLDFRFKYKNSLPAPRVNGDIAEFKLENGKTLRFKFFFDGEIITIVQLGNESHPFRMDYTSREVLSAWPDQN